MGDVADKAAGVVGSVKDLRQGDHNLAPFLPADIEPSSVPPYLDEIDAAVPTVTVGDDYRPRLFNGPRNRAAYFHGIPRGGNTNDIVSLTRWAKNGYEDDTAREYVRGIVVVSIVMALVYIVWAVLLLLLRAGRIGECCCWRKSRCGRSCVESSRARGGWVGRNVCGWMAGRPPKRPTKTSLRRDRRLKEEQSSIGKASSAVTGAARKGASAIVSTAGGFKSSGGGKEEGEILNLEAEEDKVEGDIRGENEDAVAGKSGDADADGDAAEEAPICEDENSGDDISDEYLAKRQRREERCMMAIRSTFLVSAIIILAASIVLCLSGFRAIDDLIGTSRDSLVDFERYFSDIVADCDGFIVSVEEAKLRRQQFVKETLGNIFTNGTEIDSTATTNNMNSTGSRGRSICLNAQDGIVSVDVNLGELFDGPLIKLVEVKDAATNKVKITVVSFLDETPIVRAALNFDMEGLKQVVSRLVDTGKEVANGTADTLNDLVGTVTGAIPGGVVDNVLPDDGNRMNARMLQDTLVSAGGEAANFTIIGRPSAYKERDLSALLATNFSFTVNFATVVDRINTELESISPNYLVDVIFTLRAGAQTQLDNVQNMDESLDSIRPYWYIAVIFASFLMLLVALMMAGCILAWLDKQPRFLRWINNGCVLPVFILLGMLVWIFTCVFLCLGILSGDLCVDSPDYQVNGMLANTLNTTAPIAYNFAYYYLNGCQPDERPLLMDLVFFALAETRKAGAELFNMISNLGPGPLSAACGNDFNALSAASYLLAVRIDNALNVIASLGRIVLCKSFHPLYSNLLYDIVCTDIINALGPMFTSLILISLFSMVLVTLRVSLYELDDDLAEEEEERSGGRCCSCRRGIAKDNLDEDCRQEPSDLPEEEGQKIPLENADRTEGVSN